MINPFAEINWNPGKKDFLSFGRAMIIGFSAISLIFLIVNIFRLPFSQVHKAFTVPVYLFSIGGILFFIANIGGVPARIFYLIWFALAASIGVVISNLLLALFYYLLFSVFAVLFRVISGRDPLTLKKDSSKKSWWIEISKKKSLKSYFKQY